MPLHSRLSFLFTSIISHLFRFKRCCLDFGKENIGKAAEYGLVFADFVRHTMRSILVEIVCRRNLQTESEANEIHLGVLVFRTKFSEETNYEQLAMTEIRELSEGGCFVTSATRALRCIHMLNFVLRTWRRTTS